VPGYTHDTYLDADPRFVRWMLEIDGIVERGRRKAETPT